MRWVIAAGVSVALFAAVAVSTFVPYQHNDHLEYVFVWAGARTTLIAAASGFAVVAAAWLLIAAVLARRAPAVDARDTTARILAPLAAIGLVMLGLLPAIPGAGEHFAPLAYFFFDLRWWWLALVVASVTWRAMQTIGISFRPRLSVIDALVFAAAVVWAVSTTPGTRFTTLLHGDEPKYIRYCELWYQGLGLDLTGLTKAQDQPATAPQLGNLFRRAASAIRQDVVDFAADLRTFARAPASFRWNRATGNEGFVTGKDGGVYQIHQPGTSALLFPGYVIDRYILRRGFSYEGQFAGTLAATGTTMLLLYGATAIALFRLFRNAMRDEWLAAGAAFASVASLPLSAFAFQIYPELPAACVIAVVANYVWFHSKRARSRIALIAGLMAASLTWLHPRFLVVAVVLGVAGIVRSEGRVRWMFTAGLAAGFLLLCAYDYHITGSWSPNAMYVIAPSETTVNPSSIPLNLVAYFFHRMWGVVPHAPVLLALIGGFVVVWLESRWSAVFLAALVLALAIPAAGHSLTAAGSTPDRLIAAVMPLTAWPIALAFRRLWHLAWIRATAVALLLISLQNAAVYNWWHEKGYGPMRDQSVSGWKVNLAFPAIRGDVWDQSTANFVVLMLLVALVIALAIFVVVRMKTDRQSQSRVNRPFALVVAGTLLGIVAASIVLTAAEGQWTRNDYLVERSRAQTRALAALVAVDRCRVCFSSDRPALDWAGFPSSPVSDVEIATDVRSSSAIVQIALHGDGNGPRVARVRADFGDGFVSNWIGIVDRGLLEHRYRSRGTFTILLWVEMRDGTRKSQRETVTIAAD